MKHYVWIVLHEGFGDVLTQVQESVVGFVVLPFGTNHTGEGSIGRILRTYLITLKIVNAALYKNYYYLLAKSNKSITRYYEHFSRNQIAIFKFSIEHTIFT